LIQDDLHGCKWPLCSLNEYFRTEQLPFLLSKQGEFRLPRDDIINQVENNHMRVQRMWGIVEFITPNGRDRWFGCDIDPTVPNPRKERDDRLQLCCKQLAKGITIEFAKYWGTELKATPKIQGYGDFFLHKGAAFLPEITLDSSLSEPKKNVRMRALLAMPGGINILIGNRFKLRLHLFSPQFCCMDLDEKVPLHHQQSLQFLRLVLVSVRQWSTWETFDADEHCTAQNLTDAWKYFKGHSHEKFEQLRDNLHIIWW